MSITSTLNIAKQALLTQQAAIAVAGHNIANVDTPGYTRQVLGVTAPAATPTGFGFVGNGVAADSITRQYDQFMVQRQMSQNSTINDLATQQKSMRVIETTFNEIPGLAVNELLSKLWASWQALSNNPELSSNRQTVVQQAGLLTEQLNTMNAALTQAKIDTGVSMKSAIADVNDLTQQLADINGKITASETSKQEQNDLRDTRDNLLKKLAGYVDINHYESSSGAYTVMMSDGHTLVNNNESWSLAWTGTDLRWININASGKEVPTTLDGTTSLGGTIGGLLQINNQLVEGDPDNYLGRLNALTNALIREVNQQHSQGVGLASFSDELTSAELAYDAILLNTTVDPLTATNSLAAGTLQVNGRSIGRIDGAAATYGLAMGKTANAAQAINNATAEVLAKMTTQLSGSAATAMTAGEDGSTLSFTINGVAVSYTVDSTTGPPDDTDPAVLAQHLVDTINQAITDYNDNAGLIPPQTNTPKLTVTALVGNGTNGAALNSIVFRNIKQGDESAITISDLASVDALGNSTNTIDKAGLTAGSYKADNTHNTGELSLFSHGGIITIDGGANDTGLAQLGWAGTTTYSSQAASAATADSSISFELNGQTITVALANGDSASTVAQKTANQINKWTNTTGVTVQVGDGMNGGPLNAIVFSSQTRNIELKGLDAGSPEATLLGFSTYTKLGAADADETPGDGKLTYSLSDNGVFASLMGLDYADTLNTDGGSFDLWLYNKDGSLALAQPVKIDLTRAYTLGDVASAINASIKNATNNATPWLNASVAANQLVLKPDDNHNFAFSNDTSNFLAAIGINTFFTGHSAGTIGINQTVATNLDNVAAGQVSEFGEIFTGDNSNALLITNIQRNENITYTGRGSRTDTLDGFYNSLLADIGLKGKSIGSSLEYNQQVMDQLSQLRDASSGVSLDEEMANLIKFQHAYSAAARLITTSDEMLRTLLDTVR